MIGPTDDADLVDWRKRTVDGEPVYELEYSEPVSEPTGRPSGGFGAASGGTVPTYDQKIRLPDGETIPAMEATFEADGTTLRIRREKPSVLTRLRRYVGW